MFAPSHPPRFDHHNSSSIRCGVYIMKLVIMPFRTLLVTSALLNPNTLVPQHFILKCPYSVDLCSHLKGETLTHPYNDKMTPLYDPIFTVLLI